MPLDSAYCNALLFAHCSVRQKINHVSSVQLRRSVRALTLHRKMWSVIYPALVMTALGYCFVLFKLIKISKFLSVRRTSTAPVVMKSFFGEGLAAAAAPDDCWAVPCWPGTSSFGSWDSRVCIQQQQQHLRLSSGILVAERVKGTNAQIVSPFLLILRLLKNRLKYFFCGNNASK